MYLNFIKRKESVYVISKYKFEKRLEIKSKILSFFENELKNKKSKLRVRIKDDKKLFIQNRI